MSRQPRGVRRALLSTAVGAAASMAAFSAHADMTNGIVDTWNVDVDTVFNTTTICDSTGDCTPPTGVTAVTNKSLRWGDSTGQGQSGLDITNSPSNQNVNTNGAAVGRCPARC